MARDFQISGPAMVSVKAGSASQIASLTQLGLSDAPIKVTPRFFHEPLNVDSWGARYVPADYQVFIADVEISMTLIHVDRTVLQVCLALAAGNPLIATEGFMAVAGTRLGNNTARFAATNCYIGLNITSPIQGLPWRFLYAFLTGAQEFPLGTEKSIFNLSWKAIPYTNDPWGGGTAQPSTSASLGAAGAILWDHTPDS